MASRPEAASIKNPDSLPHGATRKRDDASASCPIPGAGLAMLPGPQVGERIGRSAALPLRRRQRIDDAVAAALQAEDRRARGRSQATEATSRDPLIEREAAES